MAGHASGQSAHWPEFGRRMREWRRRAGLTQAQLGLRVGYHHSLISKLESGVRVPPSGLVECLDTILGADGELVALCREPAREPEPPQRTLLSLLPGAGQESVPVTVRFWPADLPVDGVGCPLHGPVGCPVPDLDTARDLLALLGPGRRAPRGLDPDLTHVLTALLGEYSRVSLESESASVLPAVEWVLHALTRLGDAADEPHAAHLRLTAHYSAIAGRLRMHRGQTTLSMAWFGHGLARADLVGDVGARVRLLAEVSTLARLDGDADTALACGRAMAVADTARPWTTVLAQLSLARGHAIAGDDAEALRAMAAAETALGRLGERDHLEVPWLVGDMGRLRVDAAAGAALRDLAALTGDRALARQAVVVTGQSVALVPERMRPAALLLAVRLADAHACAGEPDAAVALAEPVWSAAEAAGRSTITAELAGLRTRLGRRWGAVASVRAFAERTGGHTVRP
ncbi:transcriptional regulator with XRE-family HTH domain [Actinokineospora baliensis]|uniref:helix-turn-helix domain-containing protein n=1 Tax=Actinokineospora baliensis TaxID=547056 RepID=UPI001959EF8C|nr:helix-turn-helix transcriptional regulator [Actinokineospora baliensis]MBM7773362.1 transcriptional regulator with XRE-family HTH domain [Actinokineospora baliensis]